jgi:hypothetical protein
MRSLLTLAFLVPASVFAFKDALPLQSKTNVPAKESGSIVSPKTKGETPEAAPAADGAPKPYIGSIGSYGSPRVNEAVIRELLGADLDVWLKKGLASDPSAMDMEKKFVKKIKKKFGFPVADWSIIQYYEPAALVLHLTLDVVEEKDVARRMPFYPEPKEEMADPGGLLKEWADYETLAFDMVEAGQLEPEAEKCVALHCPFGHKNEKLKKWEKIFVEGAKKHNAALMEVAKRDSHPEKRAAAIYVLAYWAEQKKKVVEFMVDRIKDFDPMVRNNALRVLGDVAEFHPDVVVPISAIIPALDYPRVSDRSKALYVAYILAQGSNEIRQEIQRGAVPSLISLMECKQPDHKELAHNILKKISGKDFADTDIRAWTAWYSKLPTKEISRK